MDKNSTTSVLQLKNICKSYKQGSTSIKILKDINLEINKGKTYGLLGQSGCGKTTLLQIAGLLDKPDSGEVIINQENLSNASDKKTTLFRRNNIGFIYQFHHLLPEFSALENIVIPQRIKGVEKKTATINAQDILDRMGILNRENHRPTELSGGEQQRVAIARAVVNKPDLILADEPTGNLDPENSQKIFDILLDVVKEFNLAMMVVTHNHKLASNLDNIIEIKSLSK